MNEKFPKIKYVGKVSTTSFLNINDSFKKKKLNLHKLTNRKKNLRCKNINVLAGFSLYICILNQSKL